MAASICKLGFEMTLWIDADACPVPVRDMVLRASTRTQTPVIFVANSPLPIKPNHLVKMVQVEKGFDVADNYICQHAKTTDLVVTQDIPLASDLVEKGITALNPRGELYTQANIKQRLAMRNLMEDLRDMGHNGKGHDKFGSKEKQSFANALDKWLTQNQ